MIAKFNSVFEDIDLNNDGIEDNIIIKEDTIHIINYPKAVKE